MQIKGTLAINFIQTFILHLYVFLLGLFKAEKVLKRLLKQPGYLSVKFQNSALQGRTLKRQVTIWWVGYLAEKQKH